MVSRRLHATHSGGCGFCFGFGTTLRRGICTYSPSAPAYGSSPNIRVTASSPPSHLARFPPRSIPTHRVEPPLPQRGFRTALGPKAAELELRAGLTLSQLDPGARDQVERGGA